jgi:hypothetical protein
MEEILISLWTVSLEAINQLVGVEVMTPKIQKIIVTIDPEDCHLLCIP